jgi:phosphoribosylanthranilate isomerase
VTIEVKICGLNDAPGIAATVAAGVHYAGFVFYRKSPRFVGATQAAALIEQLPSSVRPVGLFVDPHKDEIVRVIKQVSLRLIQLHGSETPSRVAEVKELTRLPIIKAIGIGGKLDLSVIRAYEAVADYLLFDTTPGEGDMPGGNARAFDWNVLKTAGFSKPWFLAGGLNAENIAQAIAVSGAKMADVSSGVEDSLGHKSPAKIKAFVEAAQL